MTDAPKPTLAGLAAVKAPADTRRTYPATLEVKNSDGDVVESIAAVLALVPQDPRLAVRLARVEKAGEDVRLVGEGLDAIPAFIADIVVSWDLDEVPPTTDALAELDFEILMALFTAVGEARQEAPKDHLPPSKP